MLKWTLLALVALVLLIALVAITGALVPRSHVATRTLRLRQLPRPIWDAITNVEAFPTWRSNLAGVERLPDQNGRPVWREVDRHKHSMTLACEEFDPPRRLVARIVDKNLPFGGTWTWTIEGNDAGSEISITENGEIYNPIFRFMARFVLGYTATIDGYLEDLDRHLGKP